MRRRKQTRRPRLYAVYTLTRFGVWAVFPARYPTLESAEEWVRTHLVGDYLITDLSADPN